MRAVAAGGTVTLLFTDLVGSTDLIERLGDDAAERLSRRHFETLRSAVAEAGGREVKSLGDGLMVTFPSALAALSAATAMQQAEAAAAEPLGLRVGVHAGEPVVDDDDFFGQAVVVAKRLCDAADGGEIRVSGLVRDLIGTRGGLRFRDLGAQSLKGIADPVRAYSLLWNDAEPARARPADARIELCGALSVEIAGRRLEGELPGGRGRSLFAYLVLNRDRAVRRDELVAALWPDDPPESPERALATVIARVRGAVGPETIEGRAEIRLVLPAGTRVDVEAARDAVAEAEVICAAGDAPAALARAEQALKLAERPLLPGLEGKWVDDARRAHADLAMRALELVAAAGVDAGGPGAARAERAARALVELDPFRESAHGLLMRALAAQGNIAAALRAFDDLRVMLRDELGVSPGASLRELNERLLAGETVDTRTAEPAAVPAPARSGERPPLQPIAAAAAVGPIFGRDDALDRLDELLGHAASGTQSVALLAGEPGIGKTRLAAELASRAYDRGMTVLLGRCEEHALASFGPFLEAIRHAVNETPSDRLAELAGDAAPELARLVPEIRTRLGDVGDPLPGDPEAQRLRLFEATACFLARTARPRGALLVLEDLHWADPSTLQMLGYLGRGRAQGLSLVITYRATELGEDHELRQVIAGLVREPSVERLNLTGLDAESVSAVIEAISDRAPDPAVAREVQEQTAGNPFFVTELVRRGGGQGIDFAAIPEGVRDVVAERVRRLGREAAELLVAGAVCGREFALELAGTVGGVDDLDAIEALESAMDAGLVREVPDVPGRAAFAHALVRETLYERLSAARRAAMHRRAAEAIEATGGHEERVAELAHHYDQAVRGRERTDASLAERARHWLEAAGDAAVAVHSSQEALARYARARELAAGAPDGGLSRVTEKEGDVCLRLGRFDAAHARWQEALETIAGDESPQRVADLRRKLGDVLVENGYLNEAIDQYKAGIALCGSEPSAAVARLYGESAWLYLARGDHMLAVYAAERAVGVTSKLGEPRAASRAHAIFGRVFGRLGDAARAREQLDRALELAREADPFEELRALRSLADHVDGSESRSAAAADLYEQALEPARQIGDVPAQLDVRAALGQLAVEAADWDRAERLTDQSARVVEREGLSDRAALPLALAGALAWRAGDLDAAEGQLGAAVETATGIRWWRVAQLANWWLAEVHRERERVGPAIEALTEATACGGRAGYVERSAEIHAARGGLLAVSGAAGEAGEAASDAEQAAARAASPAAAAASAEAAAAADPDLVRARAALLATNETWSGLGRPLAAARCLLIAAQLAQRAGARDAGDALEAAIAAYSDAGVSAARERATAL